MRLRDKKITFRVSDEEYSTIIKNKPILENLSEYIRRILIYGGNLEKWVKN